MAIENNYFSQFLNEKNSDKANLETEINQLKTKSNILELVEQKKVELGLKAQEKQTDFTDSDYASRTVNLGENFDGDTLYDFGRLSSGDGNAKGFSFDTFETAKYDGDGALIPYLGSVDPKNGSKRSKKFNLHRTAYGKLHGIPAHMVSQRMLNEAGAEQAQALKKLLYERQDPNSDSVTADIRQDGVGYFGRPLITVRNPKTGKIINEVMNTPENNAMFYSKYNRKTYSDGIIALSDAQRTYNKSIGDGFWDSMGKSISSGIDNVQATGYGFAALLADATGNDKIGTWFLDQYLRNIDEAQANGAGLPGIEDIDWSNPTQVLSKLGALIGEAMPSIALMIGTGGIGGLLAKTAAKGAVKKFAADRVLSKGAQRIIAKATNRGRSIGAYGSAMGMETGSIYGNVTEEGENRDFKGIAGSLLGGTIAGALEAFYPLKLMRKLGMGKAGSKTLKSSLLKNSAGQNLKNIGKELLSGGLTEGSTEGLQFIVEEVAQDLIKDGHLPDYKSKEFQLGLLNSIVAGLVPGATFSGTTSTVSEINNRIGGDKAALQRNLSEVRTEANNARDEAAQGKGDVETEKVLTARIATIESQAKELGIELSDTFKNKSTVSKAVFLADALNKLEIEQKALPVGERNDAVITARKTIDKALDDLNTGKSREEQQVKNTVIQNKLTAQIEKINKRFERLKEKFPKRTERYEAEQAKQIAKVEQVAANKQAKIESKARRVAKVGTRVIRDNINTSINRIKKINAKLKEPNISEGQRKKLERTRNQLGIQIDSLSKDNSGQRLSLPKVEVKNIESALGSFKFKNKRVKTKTDKELEETLVNALDTVDEYKNTKNNENTSEQDLENIKTALTEQYQRVNSVITSLLADKAKTNDPDALKSLDLQIASAQTIKENIVEQLKQEKDKPKTSAETDTPTDSLDIDILNNGPDSSILGSINSAQKKERTTVKEKFEVIKKQLKNAKKSIKDVHNEIMKGTKDKFKGLETYLKDAKNDEFVESQFDDFVLGLELKFKAFKKAQAIFNKRKNKGDAYVNKDTYEVYPNRKSLPDSDLTNYWYVNEKSTQLINLLSAEIEYAKSIKVVIASVLSNVDSKVKNKKLNDQIIANQKKIDEIIAKGQETTGSLDNVNKPKAKPKTKPTATTKPKPKEEVVKPVVKEPTVAELEDIILEEDELINKDTSTEDIGKPKDKKVKVERNKRLKAYQARHQKLIDELTTKRNEFIKLLKIKVTEGVNRAPLNRGEIQNEINSLDIRIKNHQLELDNLLNNELNEKASNHFLTKFGNSFVKLRKALLRVTDLFRIKDIERDSFFSKNENKNLNKESILVLLEKVGIDPKSDYAKALVSQFEEFKVAFEKTNEGFYVKQDGTSPDIEQGLLAKEAQKLFLDKNGNMPDEVIFAMMLSTMHYAAVNVGKSNFRPQFEIADLLYGDGKQTDRLGKAEINTWTNAGIFTKNASKDIGLEILDLLNLQAEKDTEKQFLINIEKIAEDSSFTDVIIRDSGFRSNAAVSLGLLAIQTSRRVNTKEGKLFRLRKGSYPTNQFDNPGLSYISELSKKAEETGSEQFIQWNTIQIKDSDILKIFKDNADNLKKIKGADSNTSDISFVPPKNVQEKTDNSFFVLGKKIKNLIKNLQNVQWIGKTVELDLFNSLMNFDKDGNLIRDAEGKIVITEAMKALIGYKNINEQHTENRDAIESANDEKLKDIEYVIDYYQNKDTKGLKGFYFRYKAQTQHRLRINSSTINPQRSKIMRALFNPVGSESVVTTDSDRAMFKLAIVQAFGYNIKTLEEALEIFEQIINNKVVKSLVTDNTLFLGSDIELLIKQKVIRDGVTVNLVDGASTHLLEAIAALRVYDESNDFSTTIGVETDGITNGYAIGLLQFLDGTPDELKEALERIGIFVDQNDDVNTYEKFIKSGRDDVYQAFSRKIVEAVTELDLGKQNAINILHGELLGKNNALTKFARDLAKSPVMISNYGAGVTKVLNAMIGKIVPDLYDSLAKQQTIYNKGNKIEKKEAIAAIAEIQNALEESLNIKVGLVDQLKANKLYTFTFKPSVQKKFEAYFTDLYQGENKIFGKALEVLLKPIKESRDILTKVIEAEFFVFYSEFEKQTADFPAGRTTTTAIRMHIAAQLADKLMPRMNSPWNDSANEQELIQLIRQVDAIAGRVEVGTKPFKNQIFSKTDKNWKFIKEENERTIGTSNSTSDFSRPGVAAIINMIQNMDSVVLGDLLDQKQNSAAKVLPIYDAVISPIKDAVANALGYNKSFLDRNLNHVMLENALEQYDKLLVNAKEFGIDLNAISADLKINSFRGAQITAELLKIEEDLQDKTERVKKLNSRKQLSIKLTGIREAYKNQILGLNEKRTKLKKEQDGLSIQGLRQSLVERIQSRKDNLAALIEQYGAIETWNVGQMYLPFESIAEHVDLRSPTQEEKLLGFLRIKVKTGLAGNSLKQETIDGFKGAKDAAIKLSEAEGETLYVRKLAKLLIPLLNDKIKVSSDFDRYDNGAVYRKTGVKRSFNQKSYEALRPDLILINPSDNTTVLLHELIHAASQDILRKDSKDRTTRQNSAVRDMWEMRELIKQEYELDLTERGDISEPEKESIEYLLYGGIEGWEMSQINARKNMAAGFGNSEGLYDFEALAEFLTQTLTSVNAQSYLKRKEITTTITNKSLWSKIVTAINNLLNLKEGVLLEEAINLSIESIESLKEDDQKSQGDLFDNTDKISEIKYAEDINDILGIGREDTLDSIDSVVDKNLKEVYKTNSLRDNLVSIFNTLGLSSRDAYLNKGDQQVQESHLERVLTEIIGKAGVLLDDTTVTLNESSLKAHGEANIGETSVDVNFNKFKPDSYSEQTAQEVYVHELLHILTRFALKKDSRLRQKLERIRNEVKTEIEKEARPYELFLRKDANGEIIYLTDKQTEIEAAQAQYAYLFGDKVPANAVLDEFLAYSLTNKFMVEKLTKMESKTMPLWSKETNEGVVEKILNLFTEIVERIGNVLKGKTKPASLEQEIFELTKDIVAVNQSKRDELSRALKLDKVTGVVDSGNALIRKFAADVASGAIKKGSDAYIAAVDKITKDGKLKGFLYDVLYDTKLIAYFGSSYKDFVDNHPKVQEKLNVIFRNFKPDTLKNLSSIKADLFGGVDQDFIKLLYRSHNEIDSNRRQYKELTKEALQRVFKDYDSLTNPEKESLTKIFLKTDLSVLVQSGEFTTEQVIELIRDDTALDKLLTDYSNRLKINKNQYYKIQTDELAKYMVTGKNNSHNQMLNASNIYAKGNKSKRAYDKSKRDDEIRDLDIYVSLLALRSSDLKYAKDTVVPVIDREFAADSTHNGIHGLVNLHISFKKESLKEGFNNNPTLMSKGYIATVTDPDIQLTVEPDTKETNAEMVRRGYEFVAKVDGVGAEPWALWVIKNNPELTRTKGIVSMTSKQFKGTSLKEIFGRNQATSNAIMDNLNKFKNAQTKKEAKGLLSNKYTAIPVINENLEIVDYRITVNHAMAEKHLKQELSFDEVLPTMFSQLQDKIKSEDINNEAIKLLYQYGKDNQKNNPSKFINILDEKYQTEYFQPLPKQAKFQISQFATINKTTRKEEFWVERGYLDTVFGYVNPSVSNIKFFNNKPKSKRYAKVTEKLVKEMVSLAVVNVVIKIPIVPAVNFASNFVTSLLYTGDPVYLIKKWREGIVELNKYKNDSKALKLLDIEILGNPALENDSRTKKKREILLNKVNENPVSGFVDAGLFTSITEDINQNEFTYRNKAFNRIKETGNKLVSGKVFDIANHAYLGEHTAVFKASMQFLQMSDFIARYALYKHQVEVKGINEDQAWKTMVETFVNYDQPLNRFVAYGNDMGAILFVKYWLRIQRAGINLIKEKPLNVGLLFATQAVSYTHLTLPTNREV